MQKTQAIASLGQHRLMLPAWVQAALSADDRLKVYLTVLQSAWSHASHPNRERPDLGRENSVGTAQFDCADDAAVELRYPEELLARLAALRQREQETG